MNHSTQFEATPGGLVLSNAILLYAGRKHAMSVPRKGGEAFASIHPVEMVDGAPVICAGTPLTRSHLRQWAEALERNVAPEILPENVIVSHPDMTLKRESRRSARVCSSFRRRTRRARSPLASCSPS